MRMWGVPTGKLCDQHLLGEHVEMHMFVGHIKLGRSLAGFVAKGLVDTTLIQRRHDELAQELITRGMRHRSPLVYKDQLHQGAVDPANSLRDLHSRCGKCRGKAAPTEGA